MVLSTLFVSPAALAANSTSEAIAQTQRDIRQATADLNAAREAAQVARAPLAQRVTELETDVLTLREAVAQREARQAQSERERAARAEAAHVREAEAQFAVTTLHGYRQALALHLAPALPADIQALLTNVDKNLAEARDVAVLGNTGKQVLDLAAQWNARRLGGSAFPGTCLDPGGLELQGHCVIVGPFTFFASDSRAAGGAVGRNPHRPRAAFDQPAEAAAVEAIASVAAGGEADLVLDTRAGHLQRRAGLLPTLVAILRGHGTPQDFMLLDMLRHGWPVLSVLLLASIWSCAIILERSVILRRAHLDANRFVKAVLKDLEEGGVAQALEHCQRHRKPVAAVVAEVLTQPGGREDKERAMRHGIQVQLHQMEQRVPILGTIGSTAPFIGLLGTVAGIIRAFQDIAANAGGGPDIVSAGIAEALVTTAFGLLVAIPAVMFYNHFVNSLRRFTAEMEMNVYDVIEKLCEETPL